jgi:ATP-dependent Lhr-like helicase
VLAILRRTGHADFWQIADELDMTSEELTKALWNAAWRGAITNDSFDTLRRAALNKFTPSREPGSATRDSWPGRRRSATARQAWRSTRPLSGRWYLLHDYEAGEDDPITALERDKERARIVLARYGIVFRELLEREIAPLRWRRIFRALRLMELSGEVVAGSFVQGIPGVQFAHEHVVRALQESPDPRAIFWLSAADPISPSGLPVDLGHDDLPTRLPGSQLVFRGTELVMISRRNGGELIFRVPPDDGDLPRMMAPLRSLIGRRWNPKARVSVRVINGENARNSPYADALLAACFRRDYQKLVLSASYQ